jgi:folate-binding protein YgfZ
MSTPGAATIQLTRRGVIMVNGPDAATLLDRLLTADASDVAAGAPRPAALLTPQGKVLHELWIHADGAGGFFLDLACEGVADLIRRLTLFRLRDKVEISNVSGGRAVVVSADGAVRRVGGAGEGGADAAAYDAWRVADGRPEQGVDFAAGEAFPSDVNLDLIGGVDYRKGCFVGQEVVSRMKRRGIIRRRTLVMEAQGPAPAKGAAIVAGDVSLGEAMSSAGGRTLALVRIDRLAAADPGAITVEGRPARLAFPAWFPQEARHVSREEGA